MELIEVATTGAVKVAGAEDDDTQMWQVTVATVAIDHRRLQCCCHSCSKRASELPYGEEYGFVLLITFSRR